MPLDKNILGPALYDKAQAFNDVDVEDLEQARKDFWLAIAGVFIDHVTQHGAAKVTGVGLTAGPYPVTGESLAEIE